MGVVISKPAINLREQLTELKATQGYEERQFHFDNLVTNGTFDTDVSGWTTTGAASASVTAGEVTVTGDGAFDDRIQQNIATVIGQAYVVTAVARAGTVPARVSVRASPTGTELAAQTVSSTSNTNVTLTFVATTASVNVDLLVWSSSAGDAVYDDISVYEIDPVDNKVIHTMPKGWKPLHVFEDGALQREGSAYDYTVEYDGFNYIVKETVAPVAPYSTTVIGVRA